jgi:ribosome-binding protein aMBF1 (putative translation factor)
MTTKILCEWCGKREATNLTKFKKALPSHIGAKLEATMNLCDECRAKIKSKALKFSTTDQLDKFFEKGKREE